MKEVACLGLVVIAAGAFSCARSDREKDDHPHRTAPADHSTATEPAKAPRASEAPEEMGKHWVQNDQLRNLMKDISAKTQRNWPKNVPADPEEDQQAGDMRQAMDNAAKLADGLAAAAVRIPGSVITAKMSEAERAGFTAEANILRDQALRLGQAARGKKVEQMQQSLDALSSTCISCHSRYRDFSGQINLQRATAE